MFTLPLCCQFAVRSNWVKKWISRQKEVKEESLTDWLLDDLSLKIPGIAYKQFNRHEEAKTTGADWEWWFVFADDSFFSMRIQAKKLHSGDNYSDIARTNQYGLQIDKLIEDAAKFDFFPMYAFYSDKTYDRCCWTTECDEGIHVASAETINQKFIVNGKSKISDADVLPHCIALSKLVCGRCIRLEVVKDTPTESVFEQIFKDTILVLLQKSGIKTLNNNSQGFKNRAPDYVSNMLNSNGLDARPIATIDGHQVPLCDKVLVTDLRSQSNLLPF